MAGNKHDNGVHEQGTDETRMAYQEDTPGQSVEKYIEDRNKAYHEEAIEKKKKHFSQVFQNPLKGFPYNEEFEVSLKEDTELSEMTQEVELDEDFMSFLAVALPTFIGINTVALVGLMASEMAGFDIVGKTEKALENIKSKFKRNKNYKPSKSELETLTKIGQEVKKKDPSAYKKAEAKAKSMKESFEPLEEGTLAIGLKDRDPKERAKAQAQLKVMLKKIGNKKVGSKEGQQFEYDMDYDILSDDILADEFANPKNKNMKVKDLLKKHSKRLNVNFDESVEEGFADRQREKTKSQQKAHQKSMIKIARKSIKDYEKRNKKEEIEENADASLKKKSEKSGISVGILKQVYNRGVAAWKTGHRPGTTPEQWGHARVNSFITKGSGTWGKADKDLAKKAGG